MTILDKIINHKKKELLLAKKDHTIAEFEKNRMFVIEPLSLSKFLSDPSKTGIIAEFKRSSPSKGIINPEAGIEEISTGYANAGASGLSVLTEHKFFGGNIDDLKSARQLNNIPILRKDFIIDEFQIFESKASGADAILLIAAVLEKVRVSELAAIAHSLGMEVILEVHSPDELEKVNQYIDIVGVNNRDLKTFAVDMNISTLMVHKIPEQLLKISESGISSPETAVKLLKAGYNGFLIGELFMSKEDPVSAFTDFIKKIQKNYAES